MIDAARDAAPGIGDAATFEACQTGNPRMTVKAGVPDVMVIMEGTAASIEPTMTASARAAAAKLRP